jgi:hypothetical protein
MNGRAITPTITVADADHANGFDVALRDLQHACSVALQQNHRAAVPAPMTLSECLTLLAVALELIDQGPEALTIAAIEDYRDGAKRLIENVRPVIECKTGLPLAGGAVENVPGWLPAPIVDRLCDAFDAVCDELEAAANDDHDPFAPKTLDECIPLFTVASVFIDRGPARLTIEDVERYRARALRLIRYIRPPVAQAAECPLATD